MSAVVRRAYEAICLIERGGVYELHEDGALLAQTEHPAMADKLFFKRALEVASSRIDGGARVQLTAAGKRAFGCDGAPSPSAERLTPPPEGEAKEDDNPSTAAPLPLGKGGEGEKMTLEVFKRPTVEEIAGECRKMGYPRTDPQAFYDYYESRNPPTKGAKAEDWRLTLSVWLFHEWDKKRLERLAREGSEKNGNLG